MDIKVLLENVYDHCSVQRYPIELQQQILYIAIHFDTSLPAPQKAVEIIRWPSAVVCL